MSIKDHDEITQAVIEALHANAQQQKLLSNLLEKLGNMNYDD
jgi:uncharacterized coiled-coil protein SlyX